MTLSTIFSRALLMLSVIIASAGLICDTEHNFVPSNLQIRKLYGIRFYKCFLKRRSDGESTGN
jgi:hypothetical protein